LLIAGNLGYGRTGDDQSLLEKQMLALSPDGGKKQQSDTIAYDVLDISPEALAKDSILADAAHLYTGRLAEELLKMVQFQMMRNSLMAVNCVYIFGSFSSVKGLADNLSQSLACPVETIESISKVKIDANARLAKYINAIGALIRLK
jgi:type IV pilus assembly protein PilM